MEKKIVVPGELVTEERKRLGENTFLREGKIFSAVLGLSKVDHSVASVVALKGRYGPRKDDLVIGIVSSEVYPGYLVDINTVSPAFVSKKELRDPLHPNMVVSAKVMEVGDLGEVELGFVRVFFGGTILPVSPVKVPRMIGKNGSMLDVLKQGTGCNLMIGRNGWIWVKGGDINRLNKALEIIEFESHFSHLTQRVTDFLARQSKPMKAIEGSD